VDNTIEMKDIHSGWKKWLFVGAGFGAGAALTAAAILVFVAWYSSRPKQWNSHDVTATFSGPLLEYKDGDTEISGVDLEYAIDNKTSSDITLTPDQTFFLQDRGALRKSLTGKYKLDGQCLIPAKNKVKCQISVPADFDTSYGVDGFALFDDVTHDNIIFPKPTGPTRDARRDFIHAMLQKSKK
jgi:hypothetical protein